MSILGETMAACREEFIDRMCAHGFRLVSEGSVLRGKLEISGEELEHLIFLPDSFPLTKPSVLTTENSNHATWHQDPIGGLCLWSDDEAAELPWRDPDALISRVLEWYTNEAAGWPNDPPDLDLERYWQPMDGDRVLIVYPDLAPLVGKPCRARRKRNNVLEVALGQAVRRGTVGVCVLDVGELARPIRNFEELGALLDHSESRALRSSIRNRRVQLLLVRYTRQGNEAAMALIAEHPDPAYLKAAAAAHDGESTKRLRAGLDAAALRSKKVAIVGVGAVGSLVAEMLVRSGAGHLTLMDHDVIRPGNCIRHLVGASRIGCNKAQAVRGHLLETGFTSPAAVVAKDTKLVAVSDVEELPIGREGLGSRASLGRIQEPV